MIYNWCQKQQNDSDLTGHRVSSCYLCCSYPSFGNNNESPNLTKHRKDKKFKRLPGRLGWHSRWGSSHLGCRLVSDWWTSSQTDSHLRLIAEKTSTDGCQFITPADTLAFGIFLLCNISIGPKKSHIGQALIICELTVSSFQQKTFSKLYRLNSDFLAAPLILTKKGLKGGSTFRASKSSQLMWRKKGWAYGISNANKAPLNGLKASEKLSRTKMHSNYSKSKHDYSL